MSDRMDDHMISGESFITEDGQRLDPRKVRLLSKSNDLAAALDLYINRALALLVAAANQHLQFSRDESGKWPAELVADAQIAIAENCPRRTPNCHHYEQAVAVLDAVESYLTEATGKDSDE